MYGAELGMHMHSNRYNFPVGCARWRRNRSSSNPRTAMDGPEQAIGAVTTRRTVLAAAPHLAVMGADFLLFCKRNGHEIPVG